jgi:RimJ/RimL family protein N-acetyltransferase
MLRGEKVALRAVERDDLAWIWELRNDEAIEVLAFGPPTPRSMAEMEAWFERTLADRDSHVFVIEADGAPVGMCNLRDIDALSRRADLGISLAREQIGRGYGSDATRVLLEYGFRHLNLHRISLDTLATNERALRAYLACGFVEEGRLRAYGWSQGRYVDSILMGILREEWEARAGTSGQDTLR